MNIQIINGPNLNLLGVREKSIYGDASFETYLETLKTRYPELNIAYYQSNLASMEFGESDLSSFK